ncbi:MBL fold metallo-hydrolase [Prodigiosinella aquatilis]|nr:MBL fold metallo-hydrolase [Prodigiosinella sp. LS101]WJV52289.1 MBL fold metallo-hydrolase [Prodigiosinella sp. LS101]WJV56643.1 MBL fold metallo-hydrolase [Pectobacteriaceae bacterium C111]
MSNQTVDHYSAETGRFYNPRKTTAPRLSLRESLSLLFKLGFDTASRIPTGKLPDIQPDMTTFLAPADHLKFIWFGHSTLLLNLEGKIMLVDPVFSATVSPFSFMFRRFQPAAITLDELPKVDIILISHDHYDHLDKKAIRFFLNQETAFIVPLKVGKHLQKWGIERSRIQELDWYDTLRYGNLTFTATPARHFSGRSPFAHNKTLWVSWVIQSQSERIFFSGDSSYDTHFKDIGERFGPFDLAFMENGQYDRRWPDAHMMPENTIQAVQDIQANVFVPIHWGMFTLSFHHWSEPVIRTSQLASERQLTMLTPRLGEIATKHLSPVSPAWWERVQHVDGVLDAAVPSQETQVE